MATVAGCDERILIAMESQERTRERATGLATTLPKRGREGKPT